MDNLIVLSIALFIAFLVVGYLLGRLDRRITEIEDKIRNKHG